MIVELAYGSLFAFLIVAAGSYVGAKLALQSFCRGEFVDESADGDDR